MGRGRILILDDEMEVRDFLKDFFEDRGFDVVTAADGLEGCAIFKAGSFDLVLCDMMMPRMLGLEALRVIKETRPDQRVIMMTGVKEKSMIEKAERLGCRLYLTKPLSLSELERRVEECF
ncbi:MAG: response regulator [Candidatus Omnitrophica bacterium]|nr:response regulator [Candidatus Omnitrophota bacterium]